MAAAGGRSLAAAHSRATGSACLVPSRASRPRLRALRRSRARSGGEIPVWGPPPAARAGAWGLGAVSVPGTFRRSGAFWLRRWPRVLKAALRGSQVSGAVGVVRGAPVLVPPSAPPPPTSSLLRFSLSLLLHFPILLFSTLTFAPSTRDLGPLGGSTGDRLLSGCRSCSSQSPS